MGVPRKKKGRPNGQVERRTGAGLAQAVVAHVYGVQTDELRAATRRGARTAFARQVAMYLTHVAYGFSLAEVAAAFGRDRTTASHACHRIEDLRDDPILDRRLAALEGVLHEAAQLDAAP